MRHSSGTFAGFFLILLWAVGIVSWFVNLVQFFRCDFASPYKDEFTGRNWYTFKEFRQQGLGNVQVAVNYPF